jgi:hypothetical protein
MSCSGRRKGNSPIFFGFLVWLFASLMYSRQEKTAGEYLDEIHRPSGNAVNETAASTSV